MQTINKNKTFDAVKMMRDIRDKVNNETQNMSLADLKLYIQKVLRKASLNL